MATSRKPRRPAATYCRVTVRVRWDGTVIPRVRRVSALARATEVVEFRDGGDPNITRRLPGRTGFEPVVLERPLTKDGAFEAWARLVSPGLVGPAVPALGAFRKDVRLEVCDKNGRAVLVYDLHRCWPIRYATFTSLESGSANCLVESLTLEHDGWTRVL